MQKASIHYELFLLVANLGEFTRRAFLNNKMDLTEVDGLGDLIAAETEMQRVQALNQMSGSLAKLYEAWRNRIAKV
jgi:tRNA modification GTPase